jgi:uncharacterized membrane-anchored protein YitT (DUF2179 family)
MRSIAAFARLSQYAWFRASLYILLIDAILMAAGLANRKQMLGSSLEKLSPFMLRFTVLLVGMAWAFGHFNKKFLSLKTIPGTTFAFGWLILVFSAMGGAFAAPFVNSAYPTANVQEAAFVGHFVRHVRSKDYSTYFTFDAADGIGTTAFGAKIATVFVTDKEFEASRIDRASNSLRVSIRVRQGRLHVPFVESLQFSPIA